MQILLVTIIKSQGYSPLGDQTTCGTYNSSIGYVENPVEVQVFMTSVLYTWVALIPEKAKRIYLPSEVLQIPGSSQFVKKRNTRYEHISK